MRGARDVALAVLGRVEVDRAFAAAALEAELKQTRDQRDRALATELVLGCLRRQSWLDHLLESAATKGLVGIDPTVRRILRIAVYQLAFLERVPPRAAVSEAVEQARRSKAPGLASLVNGLLRNLSSRDPGSLMPRDDDGQSPTDELALRLGQPGWLLQRLTRALGRDRAIAVAAAFNDPSRRTMRVNTCRITRDAAIKELGDRVGRGVLTPWSIDVYDRGEARRLEQQGHAAFQDEGAQLVALAVDPRPGERILDACAGRGGKTGALAQMVGGRAEIAAADRQESKLQRLELELERQGLAATAICVDLISEPSALNGPFDRVLLDAPCSGTGTLGRRPEIRWRLTPEKVQSLGAVQAEMLDASASLVQSGGRLVYAVCSLLPAECDAHLDGFLECHGDFALVPQPPKNWPDSVPWNKGRILVDPSQTRTDGYRMLVLRRA
jgi:16S rRNA (cytosine967-C5)-methyltransferase